MKTVNLMSAVANLLRIVRRAMFAPAPCAGCPDGHAQQDWKVNMTGQVSGLCDHCAARARLDRAS